MKTLIAALFALSVAVSPVAAGTQFPADSAEECSKLTAMNWALCFLFAMPESGNSDAESAESSESEGSASDDGDSTP